VTEAPAAAAAIRSRGHADPGQIGGSSSLIGSKSGYRRVVFFK
jgi:hypothetical protein